MVLISTLTLTEKKIIIEFRHPVLSFLQKYPFSRLTLFRTTLFSVYQREKRESVTVTVSVSDGVCHKLSAVSVKCLTVSPHSSVYPVHLQINIYSA